MFEENKASVIDDILALQPRTWMELARAAQFVHDVYAENSQNTLLHMRELRDSKKQGASIKKINRNELMDLGTDLVAHSRIAKTIQLAALAADDEEWPVLNTDAPENLRSEIENVYPAGMLLTNFSRAARTLTASHNLYKSAEIEPRATAAEELIMESRKILKDNPKNPMLKDETILHITEQDVGYIRSDVKDTLSAALEILQPDFC